MSATGIERRSLLYIRLAAFLASREPRVEKVTLTLRELEELVGAALPENARYPSWWRNDPHKMHSRAWITAGWRVERMDTAALAVTWTREDIRDITL